MNSRISTPRVYSTDADADAEATTEGDRLARPLHEFAMAFTSSPRGARLARRLVSQRLDSWGHPYGGRVNDTLTLITAEPAANAVQHGHVAGRDFRVRLTRGTAAVRVEVTDTRTERVPPPPERNHPRMSPRTDHGTLPNHRRVPPGLDGATAGSSPTDGMGQTGDKVHELGEQISLLQPHLQRPGPLAGYVAFDLCRQTACSSPPLSCPRSAAASSYTARN